MSFRIILVFQVYHQFTWFYSYLQKWNNEWVNLWRWA